MRVAVVRQSTDGPHPLKGEGRPPARDVTPAQAGARPEMPHLPQGV